jgi:GNAT superfamily N-acetyltransferase
VAERDGEIIGLIQWRLIHDMFWGMFGADAEWLYVRPARRGSGIAAALVARVCADASRSGAEFLHGGGGDGPSKLYERVAIGHDSRDCHVSARAFQDFATLDGLPTREIVHRLTSRCSGR